MQVNNAVVSELSEITSICNQLEQMSTILKSLNFKRSYKPNGKNKQNGKDQAATQDGCQGLKGFCSKSFYTREVPVQCQCCCGWGYYRQDSPTKEPVEGSRDWANLQGEVTKEGGTLP